MNKSVDVATDAAAAHSTLNQLRAASCRATKSSDVAKVSQCRATQTILITTKNIIKVLHTKCVCVLQPLAKLQLTPFTGHCVAFGSYFFSFLLACNRQSSSWESIKLRNTFTECFSWFLDICWQRVCAEPIMKFGLHWHFVYVAAG